jgi:tocopherol cyclase
MFLKVYTPFVFQGNLKSHHYFEGWYFKHVSGNQQDTWSFIPGISLNGNDSHAFIQIIDGIKGLTEYIRYPLSEFSFDKRKARLKIGKSCFSEKEISLITGNDNIDIMGEIQYHNPVQYPKSLLSPGIMGWYSFVPFMECQHGIISAHHSLSGTLNVNNRMISFDNGKGYIEKDWGTSFPEAWIWMQSNNFSAGDTSFSFSIAKIPWMGKFFIGFISYLYYNKKFFLFSTYNRSLVTKIYRTEDTINLEIRNNIFILKARTYMKTAGELRAPVSGDMSRRIKESVDSEIDLSLFDKYNNLIYSDTGTRAGLEVIDKIFEYL